jgi:signal transduction histidine kinase
VADARGSVRAALAEVRGSVETLRTPPTLRTALAALTGQLDTGATTIDLAVHGDEQGHDAARTTLYRAAQEGLTNAVRHADASRIAITVEFTPAAATLTVADDGRGLPSSPCAGFGLAGMRERLSAAGGTLALTSAPGRGTTLTATVPR